MYKATATLAFLAYVGLSTAAGCARQEGPQFTKGELAVREPGLNQIVNAGQLYTIKWDVRTTLSHSFEWQQLTKCSR